MQSREELDREELKLELDSIKGNIEDQLQLEVPEDTLTLIDKYDISVRRYKLAVNYIEACITSIHSCYWQLSKQDKEIQYLISKSVSKSKIIEEKEKEIRYLKMESISKSKIMEGQEIEINILKDKLETLENSKEEE